jgi:hypothetical protein
MYLQMCKRGLEPRKTELLPRATKRGTAWRERRQRSGKCRIEQLPCGTRRTAAFRNYMKEYVPLKSGQLPRVTERKAVW